MSENKHQPDDFDEDKCDNTITKNSQDYIKTGAGMFYIVPKSLVQPSTYAINFEQGKTSIIPQE